MLSSALRTTLRRKRLTFIGGGVVTTGGSLVLLQYNKDADYKKQLMKSTAEATVRAGRLAYTGSLMAIEYGRLNTSGMSARELQLEGEVELNTIELEISQAEYTNKDNNLDAKSKRDAVRSCAEKLAKVEEQLSAIGGKRRLVHQSAAKRLLELCRANGGVYVKVGQHLANLDYLLPPEYIETLSALFDDASPTSYADVREVIKEDLGEYPETLFDSFSSVPIACASLAQVHEAKHKDTGRKLAIKVQHRGLRESSTGDMLALRIAVGAAEYFFPEFSLGWVIDEIAPQLPKELDFCNEGRNSEIAASHLKGDDRIVIPGVLWNFTSPRVLCMHFEDGCNATDVKAMRNAGLVTSQVSRLIASVFNRQVFESGFIHCDPHPANVLVRVHPHRKNQPQLVLVDHGLYKQIDEDFRLTYAKLWTALMLADIKGIEKSCRDLGVEKMYPLLAAMLTSRPFDEILERSKSGRLDENSIVNSAGDKAMIRGYAQRYLKEIVVMLDTVPRQMLLLLKMNDCMRHVAFALGSSPSSSMVIAGDFASRAVFNAKRKQKYGLLVQATNLFSYAKVFFRIRVFEWSSLFR